MGNKVKELSHSNKDVKRHENVSFESEKNKIEAERKRIEKLIEEKIDVIQDNKIEQDKDNKKNNLDLTKVVPTVTLKDFVEQKKKKKKTIFEKIIGYFSDNKEKNEIKKKQREFEKNQKEELINKNKEKIVKKKDVKNNDRNVKKEKIKRDKHAELEKKKQENEKKKLEKQALLSTKREEKKRKEEEKEKKKKEKLEKKKLQKEELLKQKEIEKIKKAELAEKKKKELVEKNNQEKKMFQEREEEKKHKIEEKERLKQESELLNSDSSTFFGKKKRKMTKSEKKEAKRLALEKKKADKLRKEEEKKQKLKIKFEEEARRKKEKEEKDIKLIQEKNEKQKKLKKEKEEARRERKEKAILIKKAQEESKKKARSERKTINEKINDWYNNISFVKDRRNRRELQRQTLLIDFEGEDAIRSEEKIMYKYVAKNNETGKVETGMFAAFSKLDVHSFLLAEGYEVYEITPQKNLSKPIVIFSPKFNASELDFFLTQLSTFLKSGITLVESVKILSKQSKKKAHANIYKSIIYELSMGENFSEALSKQGNIFPRLLINMIKTSELTGDLPETLDDMADYYRETEKTRKQMISALTYPAVVLTFAVVILIFIMVSVIPQFVSIYNDMDSGLPAITVAIISISDFLKAYWPLVVGGIIIFIIAFVILFKTIKVFRSVVQSISMNIPILGKIIIYNEVTMFTKTFASLLNHNVYITDCMEVLSKITNNEVYKMLIFDTITNLARGEAISNSFKNHWAFPTIAYEMILTGERTGQLGNMMDKVAKYYQELHKNAVGQIKAFIEPVMIIILATIVGVVLLSVILPMFDMYENIGI